MLGLLSAIVIQQYQYIIQLEPKKPNLGPKNGPKSRFLVVIAQKLSQANENQIWMRSYICEILNLIKF